MQNLCSKHEKKVWVKLLIPFHFLGTETKQQKGTHTHSKWVCRERIPPTDRLPPQKWRVLPGCCVPQFVHPSRYYVHRLLSTVSKRHCIHIWMYPTSVTMYLCTHKLPQTSVQHHLPHPKIQSPTCADLCLGVCGISAAPQCWLFSIGKPNIRREYRPWLFVSCLIKNAGQRIVPVLMVEKSTFATSKKKTVGTINHTIGTNHH